MAYSSTIDTAPRGWYVDLPVSGERVLVHPHAFLGRKAIFVTTQPGGGTGDESCDGGIAILATLAYPSFAEHVRAGRRADAQRAIEEASQFLRRRYSSMDTHVGAVLPATLGQSPAEGPVAYRIVLMEGNAAVPAITTAHTYTLRAVRSGSMEGDRCGDLELTHTGARRQIGALGGATLAQCFKGG